MSQNSAKGIKVLIAGLTPALYESLRDMAFSLPDIEQVERVPDLREAMDTAGDGRPDVLLVEMPLKDGSHPLLLKRLVRRNPPQKVVAVATKDDAHLLLQAAFLGASAFIPLDTPLEFLISTIRRVSLGEKPIEYNVVGNRGMASEVLKFMRDSNTALGIDGVRSPLSQQQEKVLMAVSQGLTNGEIASSLGLQEQTVKNYMTTILRRMGARDRVQAVVYALKNGWIDLDQTMP